MIRNSLANYALSRFNFQVLKSIVTRSPITNVPYKFFAQRLIDLEFPIHLFIEATSACNLKCEMCSRNITSRKTGAMDPMLFKKIVDESALYGKRNFCLHIFGEPLMAPNIARMIEYIKAKNPKNVILLTTNGIFLDTNKRKAILNFGVDKLTVSILAANQETYRKITGRNDYDTVVKNVIELIRQKENLNASTPIIYVRIIKNEKTLHEIEEFQKKWSSYDVVIDIREEHNYAGKINSLTNNPQKRRYPCYHLWFAPAISWDGDMSICCCDWDRIGIIGNVKENTISEIWQGKKLKRLREMHLSGNYEQIEICRDCNVWQTYPDIFFEWQKSTKAKAVEDETLLKL